MRKTSSSRIFDFRSQISVIDENVKRWAVKKSPPSFTDSCVRIRTIQVLNEDAFERCNHIHKDTFANHYMKRVMCTWNEYMCKMKSHSTIYDSYSTCTATHDTWMVLYGSINIALYVYATTAFTVHYSDGTKEICDFSDFANIAFSLTLFYTLKFGRRNTYTCVEYIIPRLSTPTLSQILVYRSSIHFSKCRNKKSPLRTIFPPTRTHQRGLGHEAPLAELGTLKGSLRSPF